MNTLKLGFVVFLVSLTIPVFADEIALSDSQIRKIMISESIRGYPGNCPCPYNSARNGSRCGKRSAWSRGGGYSPLCYETDISEKMVKNYRERMVK